MLHAWDNYKLYAWGKNELRPLSKRPHTGSIFGTYDLGATIVDGLDTLYIMGLAKEFEEGRDWIARRFTFENVVCNFFVEIIFQFDEILFNQPIFITIITIAIIIIIIINQLLLEKCIFVNFQTADLSVFETNIRYVGGLLSLYAFTGDTLFKDKAKYVADKLLPAFQTPTGIPNALVNFKTGVSTD